MQHVQKGQCGPLFIASHEHLVPALPAGFKSYELRDVFRVPVTGFPRHLIFYRLQDEQLLVLRVVHGARELETLFTLRPRHPVF